jgi:hypothetical protein
MFLFFLSRSDNDLECTGVDPNRNYAEGWGTGGSSPISCSDAFMGLEPFSEIETQNVRDFVNSHKDQIKFFNDIHSYSQFIMYPWGHLREDNPYIEDIKRVANLVRSGRKPLLYILRDEIFKYYIPIRLFKHIEFKG